ncbi:MAG: hypothetical protein V4581_05350 [Bacteroidota bacterium]
MQDALWKAIRDYLSGITRENFSGKYDDLANILIEYNEMGMGRDAIMALWSEYARWMADSWDVYQDEVFVEISNRLEGYCPPHYILYLKP